MSVNHRQYYPFIILFFIAGGLFSGSTQAATAADLLDHAIAGDHRESNNVARDQYRHPKETLQFLGWRPEMTVVEIWPGGGWYTEILAPITRPQGQLYAAGFALTLDNNPQYRIGIHKTYLEKLNQRPDVYDHVVVTELGPPQRTTIAPPGSADIILTFRNVHNWMKGGFAREMFQTFARILKPGGILGITEHRAKPGTDLDAMIKSGYVTEEHVIGLAQAAGFVLEERSEINANSKDTADHPAGVWTLPPSLRYCKKMQDQKAQASCTEKYLAIGESDRMTLRFRKQ